MASSARNALIVSAKNKSLQPRYSGTEYGQVPLINEPEKTLAKGSKSVHTAFIAAVKYAGQIQVTGL